jgi:CYTH domain-containing protein
MDKTFEVERKFLLKKLPELEYDRVLYIKQYYLEDGNGYSDRIRKTQKKDGDKKYHRTKKYRQFERANEEIETELTKQEFNKLKKKTKSKISKYRHILKSGDFKWEIDKFENIDLVIAEIEIVTDMENLNKIVNEINSFPLPEFITDYLIMEVSDFKPFSNKRLAIPYSCCD